MVQTASGSTPEQQTAVEPVPKRRRLWVPLAVLCGVAAGVIVVVVFLGRTAQEDSPIEAPGGIVLSQTCVNQANGITVHFPDDWAVYGEPETPEEACRYYRRGDFAELSLVEVWASPLEVFVAEDLGTFGDLVEFIRRGGFGVVPSPQEPVEVGGHSGWRFDLEMDLGGTVKVLHMYVVALEGGNLGSLPVIIEAQGELGTAEYADAVVIADAIVTAIEFE